MNSRARIEYRTRALREAGLWRDPRDGLAEHFGPGAVLDTRSNDYLGLAQEGVSRETPGGEAGPRWGAGASRVVSGTWHEHLELESALAGWLRTEACLLFTSGYAANVGVVSALAGPGETVFSDALNHASIIDGCRLSRANVVVLPHARPEALERALNDTQGVRWVVTESYFGMDGDSPDLRALRRLCDAHGAALVVDEAHALGVFGPEGRGLCADAGVIPDVLIGGLGKAFGSQGGFAACDVTFRDWLWNRARSLVFSTATSPALCRATLDNLRRVQEAESARSQLRALERALAEVLQGAHIPLPARRHGPVFPVIFGSEAAVLDAAAQMRALGVRCQPIRPPTVPRGASRLRVILRADMTETDVQDIGAALVTVWRRRTAVQAESGVGGAKESPIGARESLQPARGADTALAEHPNEASQLPPGAQGLDEPGTARTAVDTTEQSPAEAMNGRASSRGASGGADGISGAEAPAPSAKDARPRNARTTATWSHTGGTRAAREQGEPARWVVLGTGTGIGKTFVARALVDLIAGGGQPVAGLKPIETGIARGNQASCDAALLAAGSFHVKLPAPHPLYALPDPVTPSLAARRAGTAIHLAAVPDWAEGTRSLDGNAPALVIETAGGAFSPISDESTNLDLALALGPAKWILVAPDRLGVLHDLQSCLQAMRSLARWPDWIILSAPEIPDASTGTNAPELQRRPSPPIITLPRHDPVPLIQLLQPPTAPSSEPRH